MLHAPGRSREEGAFALARRSLRTTAARPEAAILLGLILFGVELLAALLLSRLLGLGSMLRLLLRVALPPAETIAALLSASLPLAALCGMAAALAVAWTSRRSLAPGAVCLAGVAQALAFLGALAGGAVLAAGGLSAVARALSGGSLQGAILFALAAGPGALVAGLSIAFGLVAVGRIGGGATGLAVLGHALADLLVDPARSARRLGALALCALPFLALALLCGGAALLSASAPARVALLLARALCSGFALLWLADGARLVIASTPREGSLGATPDRC